MKIRFLTEKSVIIVVSSLLLLSLAGCPASTGTNPDDCGVQKSTGLGKVLTPDSIGKQYFILATPSAKNNCEAHYLFDFSWAGTRAETDTSRPALGNLEHSFAPADEFAYFPHELEKRTEDYPGGKMRYIWVVDFKIGNKNTSLSNTRYGVSLGLDRTKGLNPGDSVQVRCVIYYSPY